MLNIYPSNETTFADNGLKILKPLKAIVRKEDNGDYFLDIKDTIENENLKYYQAGNIVRATTPWGYQAFRLTNPEIENKKINVRAFHIYYDSNNYIIRDSNVVDKNCNDALDHLNSATDITSPFTTLSDVQVVRNYRCIRKTLNEAIYTILERWGGHLVRNNFHIEIRDIIGQDKGIVLSYGKNIKAIKSIEHWNDVVTKLMPVGKDGLLLPELWLYSYNENIRETNPYDIPYTKVITFDQNDLTQEDFMDEFGNPDTNGYHNALEIDLRTKALNHLNENSVPKINYSISAYLEDISDVGDIIYVKHPKCRIDIETSVIALEYDVISNKITKIEFGNFKNNLKNLITNIENKITEEVDKSAGETTAKLEKELIEATNKINSVLGNSYVIYDGSQILILDKIPKEEAINVMRINSGGIGFSQTGINGTFNSAWTIDGQLDMQMIQTLHLTADLVKGGTLKLGSNLNESGKIELYNDSNTLICEVNKEGINIYCDDGTTIRMNANIGFCGYDIDGTTPLYWVSKDEFHMEKSVIEHEITLSNRLRFIKLDTDSNTGIGVVALV
ncbi:MAG: phage tail protein [Candidatus Improbicoccus pseudotrichonymphae]|uniref:Phage tail protein n=1 Tax=Candidatus Improbicoccus pseudotrichonymphae TaxID=3033792 RepID=A0AA48I4K2_9FIRM|nr:MAG: phage tail protein [Candidatus Improbicoccus pseudotrichonymphae]